VASVLAQTDPDLELVVVPGPSSGVPALPDDPRVRVIAAAGGLGAARSAAVAAARGELLAFCDDDDTWRPEHLEVLRSELMATGADLVYGDSAWTTDDTSGVAAWSQDYDVVELAYQNYVFATDVLTRTEAVRRAGGFDPALTCYEDWDLWLRMSLLGTFRHTPRVLAQKRWHEQALLAFDDWERWLEIHSRHQDRLQRMDLHGRTAVMTGAARHSRFRPETWSDGRREVIWQSRLSPRYGYGLVGRQLLRALQRQQVDVMLAPSRDQLPADFRDLDLPLDHWGRLGFYYDLPGNPGAIPVARVVSYFMWESAKVPDRFVERINRSASLQLVPCHQNARSFHDSGVDVPIDVLPHGIDPARFAYLERPEREIFTFGTFSDLSSRKGIDVLVKAFAEEFSPSEPVRLLLKGDGDATSFGSQHPSIEVVSSFFSPAALTEWLRGLDAFVLPSRGEGFGLTGLEAMASGLPLIATDWSGPADYLDPADSYQLSYELLDPGPRTSHNVVYEGAWAEPSVAHLRELLRRLADDPAEGRRRGRAASQRVHRQWTWDAAASRLRDLLDAAAGA